MHAHGERGGVLGGVADDEVVAQAGFAQREVLLGLEGEGPEPAAGMVQRQDGVAGAGLGDRPGKLPAGAVDGLAVEQGGQLVGEAGEAEAVAGDAVGERDQRVAGQAARAGAGERAGLGGAHDRGSAMPPIHDAAADGGGEAQPAGAGREVHQGHQAGVSLITVWAAASTAGRE